MKQSKLSVFLTIVGLILTGVGFVLLKMFDEMTSLPYPYLLIGIGCGTFGGAFGDIMSKRSIAKNPKLAKQMEIEQKDERNQLVANKAKAKAYDCMVFVFGALMLTFALMNVTYTVILLIVCAYLFVIGYGIFYRCKYNKEL